MSERNNRQKYKLSRNKDGSINSTKLKSDNTEAPKKQSIDGYPTGKIAGLRKKFTEEHLFDSWKKQSEALDKELSLKEELGINKGAAKVKQTFKKHKPNNVKIKKKTRGDGTNIIINFKMPKFSKPNVDFASVSKKQRMYAGATLAVLVVVGILVINNKGSDDGAAGQVSGEKAEVVQFDVKPEFAVLSPDGAGVGNLGGFAKISPPDAPPVYTYKDEIVAVPVTVSQQQLPEILQDDRVTKLKELAEQFNAKDEIYVDDDVAYIGTSVKGPQSVVFVKGNILMLIASDTKISNKDWVEYLATLKY